LDPQIARLLQEIVTWEPRTGVSGRGQPTYGTAKTLNCYPVSKVQMVRNVKGEEVVSMCVLYFEGNTDSLGIKLEDRITLADGRRPPTIAIQSFMNEQGNYEVVEVYL